MNLSSVSNRNLTLLRKLNRKKYRQKEQLFLLEGARAVEQILKNNAIQVKALFFDESQQYWLQEPWKEAIEKLDVFTIAADLFAEISDTDTPQGVLAMCYIPDEISIKELASREGVIIALDAVQDPGNLGTIIRTASWFGAAGMVSGKGTVDLFHPKVVRGTAGATGVLPHINGDLSELLPQLEAAGRTIFALDVGDEAVSLAEMSSAEKAVLVVGNEAHGIDTGHLTKGSRKIRISSPKEQAGVESLNAAVATSIALYDLIAKKSLE